MQNHPDHLRSPEDMSMVDPRNENYVTISEGGIKPRTLDDHYKAVAQLNLHSGVPEKVRVQFETSKNIFLYAWCVYRFYPVVRLHAYACLELALNERFRSELFQAYIMRRNAEYQRTLKTNPTMAKAPKEMKESDYWPGIKKLMKHAVESGHLANEGFSAWRAVTEARAKSRRVLEAIKNMGQHGVSSVLENDMPLDINEEDKDHDYLNRLVENVPELRNHFAHGTSSLDNQSLNVLRVVSEIIDQIFPKSGVNC